MSNSRFVLFLLVMELGSLYTDFFSFLHFYYTILHNRRSMLSIQHVNPYSVDVIEVCSFLAFHFTTTSSSSSVNNLHLMSCWPSIISLFALSMVSRQFPCKFLKCSFNFGSLSSWLKTYRLTLQEIFLHLTFFTVSYAKCDCIYCTKYLISLISPRM